MKNIYPIYLSSYEAKNLIEKHAYKEFIDGKTYSRAEYSFSARIEENGDVELSANYTFDDGYCAGSGRVFSKVVRPFDDAKLQQAKIDAIMEIAEEEFYRIEQEKKQKAILKLAQKMFPDDIVGK